MKKIIKIAIIMFSLTSYSQQGKIFIETNYNTFSHSSLQQFQKEFKADIAPIPVKTVDDFPANIGFTLGYEITDASTAFFLSYNSTGGKLSYSDYSGVIRIEQPLKGYTAGGNYQFFLENRFFN